MNFDNIKDIIENTDAVDLEKNTGRRDVLRNIGSKVLAASIPFAAASLFNKAYGQTTNNIITALNRLLKIERVCNNFFKTATDQQKLIPAHLKNNFIKIAVDDFQHVNVLKYLIDSLSGTVDPDPSGYDFTGGSGQGSGPFPFVFNDFREFLSVGQILKDTSVRAYAGILPTLLPKIDTIYNGANMHTVEARHAAFIRLVRVDFGVSPWVTGNQSGIDNPASIPPYSGQENTIQSGIEIININGFDIDADAASEAFDEPFLPEVSMQIFNKFIIQ